MFFRSLPPTHTQSQQRPGSHQDLHRFPSPPSRFQRKSGWLSEKELIHSAVLAQFPKLPFIGTTLRNKSACAKLRVQVSAHAPPTGSSTAAFYLRCAFEPRFGWAFWRGRQLLLQCLLPRRAGTWAGDSRERNSGGLCEGAGKAGGEGSLLRCGEMSVSNHIEGRSRGE